MNQWHIGSIRLGTISGSSSASFGNNVRFGQEDLRKVSDGFGSLHGEKNEFSDNVQITFDRDVIDSGTTRRVDKSNADS